MDNNAKQTAPDVVRFDVMPLEIQNSDISENKEFIQSGGTAAIYKATWISQEQTVAIKICSQNSSSIDLFAENAMLNYIAKQGGNDYAVKLLGYIHGFPIYSLVLEYMKNGDLCDYLDNNSRADAGNEPIRGSLQTEILKGLIFLHQHNIIFRDLKPENILLDDNMHAKFCDFGSARQLPENKTELTSEARVGTSYYFSPEIANPHATKFNYTKACDIYAFGKVLNQLFSDEFDRPYSDYPEHNNVQMLLAHIYAGKLPIIHEYLPEGTQKRILWCLNLEPKNRPTAEALLADIELEANNNRPKSPQPS